MQHKLNKLKETKEKVCSNAQICLVDGRKFLEGMHHDHMYFPLILKFGKEEVEDVSIDVTNLLVGFTWILYMIMYLMHFHL